MIVFNDRTNNSVSYEIKRIHTAAFPLCKAHSMIATQQDFVKADGLLSYFPGTEKEPCP